MAMKNERYDVVPTHLAIKAMRDNGYKSAAHAIAELIDNSIQARATNVELLCGEDEVQLAQRKRRRIRHVAVLDNGCGMNAEELRKALQFGNGSRLDDRTGMGRFGMGLPSASISQCKIVEVWSWQNGIKNALHTYINLPKVEQRTQLEIPEPEVQAIPEMWRAVGRNWGKSGTLVVWSELDRMIWKTANAILDNSEFLVGRMYRRFINRGDVAIRLAQFLIDNPKGTEERFAVANDPGYLMTPTSTPSPYDKEPMFEHYGERWEIPFRISFNGSEHKVVARFSIAKREARKGENAGSTAHGKHAARNIGVSIMRAERELELDQAWVVQYDPRERWWGVEVEFPPTLDELFGVTNNKQSAWNFSELGKLEISARLPKGQTIAQLKQQMLEEEDPAGPLLEIAHRIDKTLGTIREAIKAQKSRENVVKRHDQDTPEAQATRRTRERQEEGHVGTSDEGERLPQEERENRLADDLVDAGLEKSEAEELAAKTISSGMKYRFVEVQLEGSNFFSVKPTAGEILIKLNTHHPAYKHLIEVLERQEANSSVETLASRLENAAAGLKLLLMAWARHEDEADGKDKTRLQDTRAEWGRFAALFLEQDD